jgi:hypothetical protein
MVMATVQDRCRDVLQHSAIDPERSGTDRARLMREGPWGRLDVTAAKRNLDQRPGKRSIVSALSLAKVYDEWTHFEDFPIKTPRRSVEESEKEGASHA